MELTDATMGTIIGPILLLLSCRADRRVPRSRPRYFVMTEMIRLLYFGKSINHHAYAYAIAIACIFMSPFSHLHV